MKNANWKAPVIIGVGVIAVILMIIFGVQSSQNKAIALELAAVVDGRGSTGDIENVTTAITSAAEALT